MTTEWPLRRLGSARSSRSGDQAADSNRDSALTPSQRLAVEMYLEGAAVADIRARTGVSAIYPVLRRVGIEPSRQRRHRGPHLDAVRSQIRSALTAAAEYHGTRRMEIADYDQWRTAHRPDAPPMSTIKRVFGSWTKAMSEAGLSTGVLSFHRELDEKTIRYVLVEAATWWQTTTLSQAQYQEWRAQVNADAPLARRIAQHDGWVKAIENAGLRAATGGNTQRWNDEQLVNAVRDAYLDLNEPLSAAGYERWRRDQTRARPSASVIGNRIGFVEAKRRAGVPSRYEFGRRRVENALAEAKASLGRPPTSAEYAAWAGLQPGVVPSVRTIRYHYYWTKRTMKPHGR